jgi:hypothetical protein
MATTNINNLDGLDAVANIGAGGETFIKAALKTVLRGIRDDRLFDLFIGQMAAEGFAVTAPGSVRATLESPTVKLTFTLQTGRTVVLAQFLVDAVWVDVMRRNVADNF